MYPRLFEALKRESILERASRTVLMSALAAGTHHDIMKGSLFVLGSKVRGGGATSTASSNVALTGCTKLCHSRLAASVCADVYQRNLGLLTPRAAICAKLGQERLARLRDPFGRLLPDGSRSAWRNRRTCTGIA